MPFSFTEALLDKFGEDLAGGIGTVCRIFVVGSAPGRSSPDGKVIVPKALTLNGCGIDTAGCNSTIKELCHEVEELDLAQNQLADLSEVDRIICEMPNLWFLNLSHNDLEESEPTELNETANIRSLVLNHTHVPWHSVSSFLDAMPNLQELHLSLNNHDKVHLELDKAFSSLKRLHISGNPLQSWEDVVRLGQNFPKLQSLTMVDCKIESIPSPEEWSDTLPRLQSLNISNAHLKNWQDIDNLSNLMQLDDIRVLGIPILEDLAQHERRQHLIARLPNVKRLNGSIISHKEREDAERAFLRHFLNKEQRPKRFYDLEKLHGKLEPLAEIDLSPKKTAELTIHYMETEEMHVLDLQQSVQELKMQLKELCGLPVSKMKVFYVAKIYGEFGGPEELRYNSKKLYTYNMQDGDEILIVAKP